MPYNPVAFKERDVRRAIRGALKEDLQVSGYEIKRDGTIRVLTVPPGATAHVDEAEGNATLEA